MVMINPIGARQASTFKAVCTAPSFNKTPVGASTPPLPYPVSQDLVPSTGVVGSVRFNGNPAYVLNQSRQPGCEGDAAGSAGGVKSGTVGGEVRPTGASTTVRVGGQPIVRDGDPCTLNAGNCPGVHVTTEAPSGSPADLSASNPPVSPETPEEQGFWAQASPWVHGVLGVASFVPGLSVVTGGLDAVVYGMEGNYEEALLSATSMIPGGKVVTTAGRAMKGAVDMAKAADAAKDAARAAEAAADAARAAEAARDAAKLPTPPPAPPKPPKPPGDGVKVKGSGKPPHEVPCFRKGKGNRASDAEYDRQLADQETALNQMSVEDYQKARAAYQQAGRGPDAAAQTKAFRARFQESQAEMLGRKKIEGGMDPLQAEVEAQKEAADMMKGLDALHSPDLIAGGSPTPSGMGDPSANRSIGGQWPQNDRVRGVDQAAQELLETLGKDTKMNVKLTRCK